MKAYVQGDGDGLVSSFRTEIRKNKYVLLCEN